MEQQPLEWNNNLPSGTTTSRVEQQPHRVEQQPHRVEQQPQRVEQQPHSSGTTTSAIKIEWNIFFKYFLLHFYSHPIFRVMKVIL